MSSHPGRRGAKALLRRALYNAAFSSSGTHGSVRGGLVEAADAARAACGSGARCQAVAAQARRALCGRAGGRPPSASASASASAASPGAWPFAAGCVLMGQQGAARGLGGLQSGGIAAMRPRWAARKSARRYHGPSVAPPGAPTYYGDLFSSIPCMRLHRRLSLRAELENAYGYVSWALRPGPDARIAIINAVNTVGSHWQKMVAAAVSELGRQSLQRVADCLGMDGSFEAKATAQRSKQPLMMQDSAEPRSLRGLALAAMEAIGTVWRVVFLALLFGPVFAAAPLLLGRESLRPLWMRWFRWSLESGGPAFIKWGQWAASRQDLFPRDMCDQLEMLQSSAPEHSFWYTKKIVERSLGMPIHELFDTFEESALASGSIGQVHRATLGRRVAEHSSFPVGTRVVVKVKHAGVDDCIRRDFAVMTAIAEMASKIPALEHLRLKDNLHQFAAPLREQVDLSYEASNLFRFSYNFRGSRSVCFPVPVYPLVMPDVLVETYEAGEPISRYVASPGHPLNKDIAAIGCRTYLKMLLVDNYLHSDLHPGNILVRTTQPEPSPRLADAADWLHAAAERVGLAFPWLRSMTRGPEEPQIVLLDVGMATGLQEEDKEKMLALFEAFASMDGYAMADATLKFSDEQTCEDPEQFCWNCDQQVEQFKDWDNSGIDRTSDALLKLLELIRIHKVIIPGHICAVLVTALVLESWSGELDNEHSVVAHLKETVGKRGLSWRDRIPGSVDLIMSGEDVMEL